MKTDTTPKTVAPPSSRSPSTSCCGSFAICDLECYPGCSGDPISCPENDGYGCGKPNPETPDKREPATDANIIQLRPKMRIAEQNSPHNDQIHP